MIFRTKLWDTDWHGFTQISSSIVCVGHWRSVINLLELLSPRTIRVTPHYSQIHHLPLIIHC